MDGQPNGAAVTRREYDQFRADLREDLAELRRRLDRIDTHGTRSHGATEQRLLDVTGDVAHLQEQMEQARRDQRGNRRWMVSTIFAGLGIMITVLSLLADIWMRHAH